MLLQNNRIQELIELQSNIIFEIRDDDGELSVEFPENVDQLYYECYWNLKDKTRLKALFELFSVTLDELVKIGSASPDDPGVKLK